MAVPILSPDIVSKIKQIEIYTKRLLNGPLIGENRSAIKGTGFDFDQIRQYQMGDDVRFIDWNASARADTILVKQYMQERSRTVFLAVDISASTFWGVGKSLKHDSIAQIASVLSLVAQYSNDYVGLLLFSDQIEEYIPARQGLSHVRNIMQAIFSRKPVSKKTCISVVYKKLIEMRRNDAIVIILSDFIDDSIEQYLATVAKRYYMIAIRCLDTNERSFPVVGYLDIEDAENGQRLTVDTRVFAGRSVEHFLKKRLVEQDRVFKKYGIDLLDVTDRQEFMGDLIRFFRRHTP